MPPAPRERLPRVSGWLRRHRVGLLVTLAVVLALRAALPVGLARLLESQLEGQLGRGVRVENVDVELLAGELLVEGLSVGAILRPDEPTPELDPDHVLLRVAGLQANVQWLDLLEGEVQLAELRLVDPELGVLIDRDGRLVPVISPLLAVGEEVAEETGEEDGAGLPVLLDQISVERARLVLVNQSRPDSQPLELGFDVLELADLAFRDGEIAVGGVELQGLRLRLARDIDLSAFQGEQAAPAPEPGVDDETRDEPRAPVPLRIADLAIDGARFELAVGEEDLVTTLHFVARDVNLAEPFPLELGLELEEGSLEISGQAAATPVSFDGRVSWSALPLPRLAEAAAMLPVSVASGTSDGELEVKARLGPGPDGEPARVRVSGRVSSQSLVSVLEPQAGTELALGWESIAAVFDSVEVDPDGAEPLRASLAELRVEAPRVRVKRSAGAPPASEPDAATAAEPEPSDAATPRVRVAKLELTNGEIDFTDETVKPSHHSAVRPVALEGSDLRWPERTAASLRVSANTVDDAATLALDFSQAAEAGRASLQVDALRLPAWSPYLAEAAGYWVEDGVMSLDATVELQPERVVVDGNVELLKLAMNEVEAGSFEKAFGISLDLALALLRDPTGRIAFPVPVTLDDRGTGASMAPLVVAVLRQAILGALTSPLKGVGMLIGTATGARRGATGMQLGVVGFEAGSTRPAAGETAQLEQLAEVLSERPGLSVVLHGRAGPADDAGLQERILIEAVREDSELPPVSAGFLQKRRLTGALKKRGEGRADDLDAEDAEVLWRWIASVEVNKAGREELARERAEDLRRRLVDEMDLPKGRIRTGDPLEGDPAVLLQLVSRSR